MALSPGSRLGSFEILALAGAGGMGEVYKARDTRLDRIVAIKILPPSLASEPQFRERFQREARTISQLDHPNICQLHDIGEHDGMSFLVMQYLEGETLAERLSRAGRAGSSPGLPLDEVLKIANEVGHALDMAHRAGVVHRDLKPGNIFLTRTGAKLLDFGLAKANATTSPAPGVSMLPTTPPVTAQGTVLGTFQYMAPEQIEGQEADARSDIFAFGLVLYEMFTGRPAFVGKTPASVMGAILRDDPAPVSGFQPELPIQVDRVVQRCLAKDPDERWQSVRDVVGELNWASQMKMAPATASPEPRRNPWLRPVGALVLLALVALTAVFFWQSLRESPRTSVIRFQIPIPSALGLSPTIALSPDGRTMAFSAADTGGGRILYLRSLESTGLRAVAQVRQPNQIAWSPDGRRIAFATFDGELSTFDPAGGTVQKLCQVPTSRSGMAWGPTGDIVFGSLPGPGSALYRLEPGSTTARPIVSETGVGFLLPSFADQGRLIVYLRERADDRQVCVVDLDGKEMGCSRLDTTTITYSETGHLLFSRETNLLAQRFDPKRATLIGDASVVADQVGGNPVGVRQFGLSVGRQSVLAYLASDVPASNQLAWFDREGQRLADVGQAGFAGGFDVSRDNNYVVALRGGAAWVIDIARGVTTRADEAAAGAGDVVWAPDGRRFARHLPSLGEIVEQPAFGGQRRTIVKRTSSRITGLEDWSDDDKYLAITIQDGSRRRAEALPLDGSEPIVLAQTTALIDEERFSPDTNWVLYNSDESGRNEVYVIPFPPTGERWQVSQAGGVQGRWRGDSREIYFLAPDGTLMAVSFSPAKTPTFGNLASLFKTGIAPTYNLDHYEPDASGRRFLLKLPPPSGDQSLLNVVLNWTSALPER